MTRHYDIGDWADFSRALDVRGNLTAMWQHRDAGCAPCGAAVSALERVAATARGDGAVTPPGAATHAVKAFFDLQHADADSRWRDLRAWLAFDSALVPATASRSSSLEARRLLFESDAYTLELSVDYSPGDVDSVVRGQILEAHGEPRTHTPVFLVDDGQVVGRAISEQHGHFEMSGRLNRPCELWVFPDDDNRIRLTLKPDN